MTEAEVEQLIKKYNQGKATSTEKVWLENWFANEASSQQLADDEWPDEVERATMFLRTLEKAGIVERPRLIPLWFKIGVAASILFILSFGTYWMAIRSKPGTEQQEIAQEIPPGGNQAILTLSNGKKIVLDQQSGKIADEGQSKIFLSNNGDIDYRSSTKSAAATALFNTPTVPLGNHRNMMLADGTEVSLDAGSSITYPIAFNGKSRNVTVTGQVYFKVKHKAAQPFFVKVKGLVIQDLGTEFNINAYDDERMIKTTLVEGSLTVNKIMLRPGEQATANGQAVDIRKADIESETAWKNNDFIFKNQDLKSVMRQIARWYNITVGL